MYLHVRLLNGFPHLLTYKAPAHLLNEKIVIGAFIRVPLRNREESAVVVKVEEKLSKPVTFEIKEALGLEPFPQDDAYHPFIKILAWYYCIDAMHLFSRIRKFITEQSSDNEQLLPLPIIAHDHATNVALSDEQQIVVDAITPIIGAGSYMPSLLHGVTGSGKTEVYKKLIIDVITKNRSVILLLPEVTLAVQFQVLLQEQLPDSIAIYSFHSVTSAKDKKNLWQALLTQRPLMIVGVHLPVLLPIANLGLIIIDEEHDNGYQEKKHPKINSKEAALIRAQQAKIPIVLGSATPSLTSMHQAKLGKWHYFTLKKRFAGAMPAIKIVSLLGERRRKHFWITQELEQTIAERLAKKEQVIIFINRRGFSFFVQCKSCSFVFQCNNCSVSLTLHENDRLSCHYCEYRMTLPETCSSCKASSDQFLKKGIGTQQTVALLQALFPHAKIARADLDTTTKKKSWKQTVKDFYHGNIDILVGTQTITKGYHFPKVTLVGMLWADVNIHVPFYNAAEHTLQQLIQVAGRAGRQIQDSLVIIQTMGNYALYDHLSEEQYHHFCEQENSTRSEVLYPPYIRFAEIEIKYENEELLEQESFKLFNQLCDYSDIKCYSVVILGPARPPIHKIKSMYVRKIYLKHNTIDILISMYQSIDKALYKSSIFFTPNPLS